MTTRETQRRFVIPPDTLGALGVFAGPLGSLSVLSDEQPDTTVKDQLAAVGVIGDGGAVAAGFEPILQVLAAPTGLAQLHVTGGGSLVEFQVQVGPGGTMSAIATPDGLELTAPAEVDAFVRMLTEHLGFSTLSSLTLSLQLPAEDAVVFAAAVDLHRRRHLEALLKGTTPSEGPVDSDDLRPLLGVSDSRWLVPVVAALAGVDGSIAEGRVGGLSPEVDRAAAQIATRFVLFDRVLMLGSVGLDPSGNPVGSQVACIQAGVHDLLVIEPGPDGVGFVTLPSAMVLSRISAILADPGGELLAVATSPEEDQGFCPSCGTAFLPDGQFCTKCGTKRP